jgi:aminopeptidase N
VWVEEAGRPIISNRLVKSNGSTTGLRVSQKDPLQKDRIWPQHLTINIQDKAGGQQHEIFLDQREKTIESLHLPQQFDYIHPNTNGMGYGLFKMDSLSLSYLLNNLSAVESPEKRAVIWIDLWENFLEQRIAPEAFMQLIRRSLPAEKNPMNTEQILSYLEKVYWRFSSDSLRQSSSRPIEKLLWYQIQESGSRSMESTYFETYRNIATTDSALTKLYRIWAKERDLKSISFSTRDYTQIAAYLSIHEYQDTKGILDRQQERIENPDRLQRFRFIRDALSPKPETRDLFFSRLEKPQNRAHEPWVIDAVRYLHHPVRQEHARKYLYPSLKMLKEIERTGDIFFPKNWLDATFSGHNSLEAALVAKSFLEVRESYPHFLKHKLLQSIDPLFRAVEMRENIRLSLKEPRSQ